MSIPINSKNIYKKGEMLIRKGMEGGYWPMIVMEATRGNNPTIINMVEVFGFEHECGSIYTNEIVARINKVEFEIYKADVGMANEPLYFKGVLIDPTN